jgi:hypothetical protein
VTLEDEVDEFGWIMFTFSDRDVDSSHATSSRVNNTMYDKKLIKTKGSLCSTW